MRNKEIINFFQMKPPSKIYLAEFGAMLFPDTFRRVSLSWLYNHCVLPVAISNIFR